MLTLTPTITEAVIFHINEMYTPIISLEKLINTEVTIAATVPIKVAASLPGRKNNAMKNGTAKGTKKYLTKDTWSTS